MNQRWRRAALPSVMALGLILRTIALDSRPLWYDEAFSLLLARQSLAEIVAGTAADTMPPLYYFLLHFWMELGERIWQLRALNVVLGLGLIYLAFLWGREAYGEREGLLTALLTAVSPFLIYHAQELRMYTLLAISLLSYGLACSRLLGARSSPGGRRNGWWGLLVISATTALYSHNLAIFTLAAPSVFLAVKGRWGRLRKLLVGQAAAAALAAPWLVIVPAQIAKIQRAFWTPEPGFLEVLQSLIVFHYNLPVPDRLIPLAVAGTVLTLSFVIYTAARRKELRQGRGILFYFLLIPPIGLLIASYVMRPVFVPRAMILSTVAYYLLVAAVIVRATPRAVGCFVLAVVVLPQLAFLPAQYRYQSFPRSPFDRASQHLSEELRPDELVLHDNKLSFFPMVIYEPELPSVFLPDEPGSHNDTLARQTQEAMGIYPAEDLEAALRGYDGFWFVVFRRALDEYDAMGAQEHPVLARLSEDLTRISRVEHNDLLLYHFRR